MGLRKWTFGAAEVVAIDVADMSACDLPPSLRKRSTPEELWRETGDRFRLCHEALASKVRREIMSVYELSPERLGTFDFVFAGDVLLHLMNPMKALQNICSVTAGRALFVDVFNPVLPGRLISYESGAVNCTWWMMSLGALESMIADAGFSRVTLLNKFLLGYRGAAPAVWRAAFEAIREEAKPG